jgi:hypothetical protein
MMEEEIESTPSPIDPHRQTIRDLQISIASYQQDGYLVFLFMDGKQKTIYMFFMNKNMMTSVARRQVLTTTKQ